MAALLLLEVGDDHEDRHEQDDAGTEEVHGGDPMASASHPERRNSVPIMIKALIVAFVVLLLATFPATWLLMLFLGNVMATGPSYWGTLPLGILVSSLLGSAASGGGARRA